MENFDSEGKLMTELLSYLEWGISFAVGNLSGILIYRELMSTTFGLNNSANKKSKSTNEQKKGDKI
ncbi:MAG TPA: hypothetical protein VLD38_06040 [Nitrosopumilaceae archaeon]|nr:hypothetical protein [Nitrosopumilaceae archaeon]